MQGRNKENSTLVLRRRPRACGAGPAPLVLLRGSTSLRLPISNTNGRALSCSTAPDIAAQCTGQVPGATYGVSLHALRSPGGLLAGFGTLRFPRRLREPAASNDQRHRPRLVSLRCSGSPMVCLRGSASPCGSCSTAPRALAVSLRSSGSPHASPMASRWSPLARCGAACGVSLRPSEPFGLLGYSFCHSRESGNPGAPVCIPLSFTQCDKPTGGFAFNVCGSRM